MTPIFTPFEAESVDYLRRRVARVGWITAVTTFAFIGSQLAFFVSRGWTELFSHTSIILSTCAGICLLTMYALCRREDRTVTFVRTVEFLCVLAACACFTGAFTDVPLSLRPELLATYILTCALGVRAAIIPSTMSRTFVLSFIVGTFLAAFVYFRYEGYSIAHSTGDPFEAFLHTQSGVISNVVTLWAISIGACVSISGVVYGLQREIHRHKQLGQYQLMEKLGEGGMGVVYRARHALLKRPTAIKLLLPDKISLSALARFEREVRLAAKLRHTNTVTIYDYGHSPDGIFYFAMELLDGASADNIVEEWGGLPPGRVVHIMAQVARALNEAHGVGLIHRDITPSNIMICRHAGEFDVAKVVDFGLAREIQAEPEERLSKAGEIAGTPLYMAPECLTDPDGVDGRCDVYSLGAVGFYLLTGHHAFQGGSLIEICSKQLLDEAPAPSMHRDDIPEDLEAVILACLAKEPEDRPQSGAVLAQQLLDCMDITPWTSTHALQWWQTTQPEKLKGSDPDIIPRTLQMRLPSEFPRT